MKRHSILVLHIFICRLMNSIIIGREQSIILLYLFSLISLTKQQYGQATNQAISLSKFSFYIYFAYFTYSYHVCIFFSA